MEFHDVLHGQIRLGLSFNEALFEELLTSPEVERLRNMRLMNFDVPLIQELGSAKRLPHSIGVCYLAQELGRRTLSSKEDVSTLMVAGLLHDAAIPPYGHLVEATLRKKHPNFDHEQILSRLLFGTYHLSNSYHQIVPGRALELYGILNRYDIDPGKVLSLVRPDHLGSAISAQIDLDNIDNVHRMACLLGWPEAKPNLEALRQNIRLDDELRLEFTREAISALQNWQDLRQRLYTLIIAHPGCVAQNAFQSDLVKGAIEEGIIGPHNWYITEPQFERNLSRHPATEHYANQLLSGSQYRLVDYVWFTFIGEPPNSNWMAMDEVMMPALPTLREQESYFFWIESGLISRTVNARMTTGNVKPLGVRSSSCLVARVHTKWESAGSPSLTRSERHNWRSSVGEAFGEHTNGRQPDIYYPENYTGSYFQTNEHVKQLELC